VSLDVEAESTILILVVSEVSPNFYLVRLRKHVIKFAHDAQSYYEARHEKHRPPVVAWPVPIIVLKSLVKVDSSAQGLLYYVPGHW
jgi:hypothetical protein|tara:strand:+ start:308 stop:565 length:258 start_codon:yes stop_codon:yes gene_type:complete